VNDRENAARVVRPAIPAAISQGRVIAIGRHLDIASVLAIGEALAASGIRAFELTMNSASAVQAIAALSARFGPDELLIGAGTVLEEEQAQAAVAAGAKFLVMPTFDLRVVEWAVRHEIPAFPGAFTPTEILSAWRAGATAVKLFPASAVGPNFLREMRGPLPQIPLIPTGGITVENAAAFLAAGGLAVGMGSWLTGGGDPAVIRARAAAVVAAVAMPVPAPAR
jgi:2-dehydro-3-deoxyphosphogluconate aldolase / (4S)-4-hydroxy-2-oxoglutarate aldolase